jgi:hypothetical protein
VDPEDQIRNQVRTAIFKKQSPVVTLFPFPISGPLGSVGVVVSIRTSFITEDSPVTTLKSSVRRVADIEASPDWVLKLTVPLFQALWSIYAKKSVWWMTVCRKHIPEICKESTSRAYWTLVKDLHELPERLSYEQGLWVLNNIRIDKEENIEIVGRALESLHPWLQPDIWMEIQKKETRTNVLYEQQRGQMLAGTFSANTQDLDIIE